MVQEVTAGSRARLESMSRGNLAVGRVGGAADDKERDLRLVKGPYWSTRLMPASPHHFTRAEFESYLEAQRFPPCTLRDRVVEHTQAVRRALVRGEFVPAEVMQDDAGAEALDLACMDVRAMEESAVALQEQRSAVLLFEAALGKHSPNGRPVEALRRALVSAALATLQHCSSAQDVGLYRWVTGGLKRISMANHPRDILVGLREGAGGDSGRIWLEFRDSGWAPGSLYGAVGKLSREEAGAIYTEAVRDGEVTLEQSRTVMGHLWRPFVSVSVLESGTAECH